MRAGLKGELLSRGCLCAGVGDLWGFFPLGRIESIVSCFGEASGGASLLAGCACGGWRLGRLLIFHLAIKSHALRDMREPPGCLDFPQGF